MKEMLLYEDANEIIIQGLKVEPQNADLKKLQVDVTKELASMRAKERKGPDGVSIILLFVIFFLLDLRNVCLLLKPPRKKEMISLKMECMKLRFDGTPGSVFCLFCVLLLILHE